MTHGTEQETTLFPVRSESVLTVIRPTMVFFLLTDKDTWLKLMLCFASGKKTPHQYPPVTSSSEQGAARRKTTLIGQAVTEPRSNWTR